MQAVLALHDDRVLDADRLVTAAIDAERQHGWVELRQDLLELAAVVAARCDDHQRALVLIAAGERARRDTGVAFRFRDQQAWVDAAVAGARAQLGDAAADELAEQGSTMSTDDALALAHRGRGARRRPPSGWDALTPTERQVLDLVVEGLTNPQIASRLVMSRATVKTHVSHCLTKLGMASRSEMAAAAARRSL
jgi:DNA-binding NarL/FixJ family response regulator